MGKMTWKITAVLLMGIVLAGCAGTGANPGSPASGQTVQRDRANANY